MKKLIYLTLTLSAGLLVAGAQAADQGKRHHAEGAFDASAGTYEVVKGDDLAAIAERFGVAVAELEKANKLGSEKIEVGQKLVVPAGVPQVSAVTPPPNPERNAYFGETHLHTSWSVDAWVMGNRVTGPADAYQYAKGEAIKHPMGYEIKIDTPLDFMGVTDHSEYVGVTKEANTPGSYVSTLPAAQPLLMKDPNSKEEQNRVFSYLLKLNSGARR